MAKTATAAFPQSPAHIARDMREQGRGVRANNSYRNTSIEERTAVLEARWEETVPTLASKADISALENRLIKWGVGAGIALLAVFAAVFIANTARMDALDAKLDSALAEIKADNRATNARIDRLDEKLDARFDALMAEIRELRK